jgi:zinc transport system substrate-binding protein
MQRIAAINPDMRIVDVRQGIALRQVDQPPGANPLPMGQGRADPHVWTSPPLVKLMAQNIRDALSEIDPAHRDEFFANNRAFAADLDRLDRDIRASLEGIGTRSFMVFHPAWGYFADTYGLKQVPIETGGKEPGARTLAQVIELGRREHVKAIFVQTQFSRRTAETIARAIGARVVAVDPLAEDYLNNLRRVALRFAEAMR